MKRRAFLVAVLMVWHAVGRAAAAELAVVHLHIDGMTWGTWPLLVKRALEGLKGVRKAEVTFEPPEAIVTHEKGLVTIDQMIQAVAKYGFTASLKGRKPG